MAPLRGFGLLVLSLPSWWVTNLEGIVTSRSRRDLAGKRGNFRFSSLKQDRFVNPNWFLRAIGGEWALLSFGEVDLQNSQLLSIFEINQEDVWNICVFLSINILSSIFSLYFRISIQTHSRHTRSPSSYPLHLLYPQLQSFPIPSSWLYSTV